MIKRAAGPIINNALMTQLAAWSKAKAVKDAKLESLKQILAKPRPRLTPPSVEDPGIARANLLKRVARTPIRVPKMEKKPVPTNYPMSKVMDVFNSVVKKPELPPPSVVPPKQNLSQGELHNLLNPKTSEYQQGILVKLAARGFSIGRLHSSIRNLGQGSHSNYVNGIYGKKLIKSDAALEAGLRHKRLLGALDKGYVAPRGSSEASTAAHLVNVHRKAGRIPLHEYPGLVGEHVPTNPIEQMLIAMSPDTDITRLLDKALRQKQSEYQQGILVKLAALPPDTRHKVMSWLRRMLGIDKAPEAPGAAPAGVAEVSSGYDRLAAMQPPKM